MAQFPMTTHSASASGTFYATAWQAHVNYMSGLEFNGFPTGQDQPFSGHMAFSGGKWWGYNGAKWKRLGGGTTYNFVKGSMF